MRTGGAGAVADLTARLIAIRDLARNEIAAAQELMSARMDGMHAERTVLLAGLNQSGRNLQDQMDRRLNHFQLQVDQRFDASGAARNDLKDLLNERYATQTKALDAAFKAAEQAVAVALSNAEKATTLANAAADKRFDSTNEFRKQLGDIIATFMSRIETEARLTALAEKLADVDQRLTAATAALELRLTSRLDTSGGRDTGARESQSTRHAEQGARNGTVVMGIMVVSLLISVAAIIVTLAIHG